MNIAVASLRGGDGKTTTAIHLAAYLQSLGSTLLLDADSSYAATAWASKGWKLPFQVARHHSDDKILLNFEHLIVDTGPSANGGDLQALAEKCDLLVIVAGFRMTYPGYQSRLLATLAEVSAKNYRVLVTGVPLLAAATETLDEEMIDPLDELGKLGVPAFSVTIPRLKAFEKAAAAGVIVSTVDSADAARAWTSYLTVGTQITAAMNPLQGSSPNFAKA